MWRWRLELLHVGCETPSEHRKYFDASLSTRFNGLQQGTVDKWAVVKEVADEEARKDKSRPRASQCNCSFSYSRRSDGNELLH
jgi:hypothetical protein